MGVAMQNRPAGIVVGFLAAVVFAVAAGEAVTPHGGAQLAGGIVSPTTVVNEGTAGGEGPNR
jgi:hypothetical protein